MSLLAVPLMVVALFALGAVLLLLVERKGDPAGHAFLGALAVCAVLGLAVATTRSPTGPIGSLALAAPHTMAE